VFLKSLTIRNNDTVIRNITFHNGINLIVDETKSSAKTDSGNSVGKTTVLRLIDFCLDGDGKNIYTDSEFKTTNTKVEKFLKNNNIIISLSLVDSLSAKVPKEILIERNFLNRSKKIQRINGEKKSNDEFSSLLKELVFKTRSDRPTFKQLKSKNIRDEKNKLVQTIRVLSPYDTDAAYEALHLFWFGIDVNLSKDSLIREKNLEEKLQSRLRKESNLSQVKQSLIIVNKEIDRLDEIRKSFHLNKEYESDLEKLNLIKSEINVTSNRISHLEMRVELIEESRDDLNSNKANIDTDQIKALYHSAKSLIPSIQKTFEETLSFHNEMVWQKLKFIEEDLPSLHESLSHEKLRLSELISQESKFSAEFSKSNSIKDLEIIIVDLNLFHEKKGALEEQQSLWEKSNSDLQKIDEKLELINNEIDAKDDLIQKRIAEFNSYFSDISSRLDGVHSLLSADKVNDIYKFSIGNIEGNPGTGGKKSQMASFDLSYIKFSDKKKIPCLHFVLQDQIENVHSNQITTLLTEIVDEVNCQYVLPVLRDKLPGNIDVSKFEILSLSQDEKLFKIR
jgi:uncharacterized protein YydD (DUF2326 family)